MRTLDAYLGDGIMVTLSSDHPQHGSKAPNLIAPEACAVNLKAAPTSVSCDFGKRKCWLHRNIGARRHQPVTLSQAGKLCFQAVQGRRAEQLLRE